MLAASVTRHVLLLVWLMGCSFAVEAADVVTIVSAKDSKSRSRVTGEIVEFTGVEIKVKLPSGREESIPAERVVDLQTTWQPQHVAADELFAQHKYDEAIKLYREAALAEKREWVQRRILAHSAQGHRNLGQIDRAVELFSLVLANDPKTQYLDALPIAWTRAAPDSKLSQQARTWLKDDARPFIVLVGASWLISLGERTGVEDLLQRLTTHPDPRVVHLADAQRWRLRIPTAKADDAARWQQQIERMPAHLRAGPYFLLGQMLARHNQHEPAALAFLRVPILFPAQSELAAESLLAAGRELETISQVAEAATLYREVLATHAATTAAKDAEERLKYLTNEGSERGK